MRRTQYQGGFFVQSSLRSGIFLIWKWDGKRYNTHSVSKTTLNLAVVNFKISHLDKGWVDREEYNLLLDKLEMES